MAATPDMIAELRRKIAEPTEVTYTDVALAALIERYPLMDKQGQESLITSGLDSIANPDWIPTYDLNSAAADVWLEKAASLSTNYDFSDIGSSYTLNQLHTNALKMHRYFRSRRSRKTSIPQPVSPSSNRVEDLDSDRTN